jgi:hypothetical protein
VETGKKKDGQWHIATLTVHLSFGDYFGTAGIDAYSQTIGMRTYVMVFMAVPNSQGSKSIDEIVKSFSAQS